MVGHLPAALRSSCQRLVQARLLSLPSQYQLSVSDKPCAVCRPSALTSLANTRRPAIFCPPLTMPNSAACLIELIVSPPALARPITLAFDDSAGRRDGAKATVVSGRRDLPSTLPQGASSEAQGNRPRH